MIRPRVKFALMTFCCVLALAGLATPVRASTVAVSLTNTTGQTLGNPPFTLGWEFTANDNISVISLGMFDSALDGFLESHAIGLWDSVGNLLVSTTIPSGTVAAPTAQFRYVSVASTSLLAGQNYLIGALFLSGLDPVIFPGFATGFATAPELSFVESAFVAGGTLNFPSASSGADPAYFSANFQFEPAAIPEPASLFLVGTGLASVWAKRRRRSRGEA